MKIAKFVNYYVRWASVRIGPLFFAIEHRRHFGTSLTASLRLRGTWRCAYLDL